ncbi:leucyl/phenylalanyl-tRNA--protein transferase [Marinicella sp. S1101]|uniref:leucyl/phenylalanyl-tRNA--protein transferase n=1 Tax=Marinicella marina TaxID=2996016 RepID=UPI002260AC25|nr:leucyl/phenylalanyl-tRNA--protein transferase [Marinicella marina]MCX7554478.1 leucyl/phenylalanyl-tRNA--protein transferase [Marinicella marina]MDJ1140629.1 leucyl/phenylalanyl-tRNA--protein transferase [Marinicella marina]
MILPCIDGGAEFPATNNACKEPDGLLCYGGDLSTDRLVTAYRKGIFPWYAQGEPILWWSPWQRMVLYPDKLHVSKSLKKAIKRTQPKFYMNRNFSAVIQLCAEVPRSDNGTWIHPEMVTAYEALFAAGHAFCIEVEINQQLVGGMYGVTLDRVYCGESMFSLASNGSKYAMYGLCQHMLNNGIELLDCQIHNPHLASMGAELINSEQFQMFLPHSNG